ncbi:hypothetical protein [Microbacterium panaciterrae]
METNTLPQPAPAYVSGLMDLAVRHGLRPSAILSVAMLDLSSRHEPGLLTTEPGVVWESYLGQCGAHAAISRGAHGLQLIVTTDLEGVLLTGAEASDLAETVVRELPGWLDDAGAVLDALRS